MDEGWHTSRRLDIGEEEGRKIGKDSDLLLDKLETRPRAAEEGMCEDNVQTV